MFLRQVITFVVFQSFVLMILGCGETEKTIYPKSPVSVSPPPANLKSEVQPPKAAEEVPKAKPQMKPETPIIPKPEIQSQREIKNELTPSEKASEKAFDSTVEKLEKNSEATELLKQCEEERRWALDHGLIDEGVYAIIRKRNLVPYYNVAGDRNSGIEGWFPCEQKTAQKTGPPTLKPVSLPEAAPVPAKPLVVQEAVTPIVTPQAQLPPAVDPEVNVVAKAVPATVPEVSPAPVPVSPISAAKEEPPQVPQRPEPPPEPEIRGPTLTEKLWKLCEEERVLALSRGLIDEGQYRVYQRRNFAPIYKIPGD